MSIVIAYTYNELNNFHLCRLYNYCESLSIALGTQFHEYSNE